MQGLLWQVSATSVEVKSGQALLEVVTFAGSQRMSCTTLKNEASSRSHAFYRLIMKDPGAPLWLPSRTTAGMLLWCIAGQWFRRTPWTAFDTGGLLCACIRWTRTTRKLVRQVV